MKEQYIKMFDADVLVMGDDWKGKFDHFSNVCDVHYFERTPSISTTEIIEVVRSTKP
jgi:glycerol-3-phosphate cytidylyltransferase-like family protein